MNQGVFSLNRIFFFVLFNRQKQRAIDSRPKRALTWTELRQIDRSIREFTTRLDDIDHQASEISLKQKEPELASPSVESSGALDSIHEVLPCTHFFIFSFISSFLPFSLRTNRRLTVWRMPLLPSTPEGTSS